MSTTLVLCAASTLAVFLSNAATFCVLAGVGLLMRRAFGLGPAAAADWCVAFWMGFAGAISFLMLWNFWWPINAVAFGVVVAIGGVGLSGARADVARAIARVRAARMPMIVAVAGAGLWLANLATGQLLYWDSALYHLRGVKWAHAYPAVPGLANLYGPLGFNNASVLYGAMVMAGPWGRYAHHVASSSLVFGLLVQSLVAVFAFRDSDELTPRCLLALFFLPAVGALMSKELMASFSTDLVMTLVILVAACELYEYLGPPSATPGETEYRLVTITALLALAVCIKFSAIAFAGIAWLLAVATYRARSRSGSSRRWWSPVLVSAAVAATMGLSWMARGIVLSGYPLFPTPIAAAPVEWRAPSEHARAEYAFIVHSGRNTALGLGEIPDLDRFATWFPRWLPRLVYEEPYAVLVPGVMAALGFIVFLRVRRRVREAATVTNGWLMLIPTAAAIAAWFMVAPEPRYALPLFWILAGVCWAQAVRVAPAQPASPRFRAAVGAAVVVVAISPAIVMPLVQRGVQSRVRALVGRNLSRTPIGPATAPATPRLDAFVTTSGLELVVPVGTGGRCIDGPLLCTPNPATNLRRRDPQDIAKGFLVDGDWQMQIWPYDWLPHFLESWRALDRAARQPPDR